MLVKFKKDYCVPLENLNDKYIDDNFVFKSGYCYYGYFKDMDFDNLIIENKSGEIEIILNRNEIEEYIDL